MIRYSLLENVNFQFFLIIYFCHESTKNPISNAFYRFKNSGLFFNWDFSRMIAINPYSGGCIFPEFVT